MKYKHHEPGALFNAHKETMAKKHKKSKHMKKHHKGGLRPASAVVKSEQNASHQFYKRRHKKKHKAHSSEAIKGLQKYVSEESREKHMKKRR